MKINIIESFGCLCDKERDCALPDFCNTWQNKIIALPLKNRKVKLKIFTYCNHIILEEAWFKLALIQEDKNCNSLHSSCT